MIAIAQPLFSLGETVATPAAVELLENAGVDPAALLKRHEFGDWGELDDHDCEVNRDALKHGKRILSCYRIQGNRLYVITEADRSSTCILLASEY